jgi:hypothetical protein
MLFQSSRGLQDRLKLSGSQKLQGRLSVEPDIVIHEERELPPGVVSPEGSEHFFEMIERLVLFNLPDRLA